MMHIDPIVAVKDVTASASWYEQVFELKRTHGGEEFAVLKSKDDQIKLCLHKWGEHEHPSMLDPALSPGNGLILYFRVSNMESIRQNLADIGYAVASDIQMNPNSHRKEFSLKDPDGYYLTISEYHQYEG